RKGGGGGGKGGSGTGSTSSGGGRTTSGSGATPAYGGGRHYGGGAAVPYTAGARSPLGLTPFLLPIAALSIFPGLWLYSAYAYSYPHPYSYRNASNANNGTNTTLPVQCLCQQYSECGCDSNDDNSYLDNLVGNGTLDPSVARVANVNGTQTLVINGTLENGTTAAGAVSGGLRSRVLEVSGWWVVLGAIGYGVLLL
ncbi:hypothetical protein LTR28_001822, partial [Elasticomyces elasticus]